MLHSPAALLRRPDKHLELLKAAIESLEMAIEPLKVAIEPFKAILRFGRWNGSWRWRSKLEDGETGELAKNSLVERYILKWDVKV